MYEGLPDKTLLICLGVNKKYTEDGRHKSGVLSSLVKRRDIIGLVDQDPSNTQSRPKTMDQFVLTESKYAVERYHHQSNGNQLIVLCPNLENWIIDAAKASNTDLTKFSLPNKASALHRIINSRLPNFERLISDLIAQQNQSVLFLQSLLTT